MRQNTRDALIRSAERLFAEKGLGAVSVKEITRAAGARNPSAVHYHFGSVESLIKEVFAQRFARIEADRLQRLSVTNEQSPEPPLRTLLEAAIAPLIETCLEEEGRMYVRFCVQLFTDPRFDTGEILDDIGVESVAILRSHLGACLQTIPADSLERRLRQALMISLIQADDFSRRIENGTAPTAEQAVREAAVSLAGYLSAKIDEPCTETRT